MGGNFRNSEFLICPPKKLINIAEPNSSPLCHAFSMATKAYAIAHFSSYKEKGKAV